MKKNSNENLKNYAIWYYLKYFPSIKKLEQKLLLKSNNVVIVNKILKEIYNIFVEENIIYSLIKTYYEKGKNQNYIKNNLKLKLFDSTIIEKSLKKFFSNGTSNLYLENFIKTKILEQKSKNKSIQSIKNSLQKSGYDIKIIDKIIFKNNLKNDLFSIKNELNKLKKTNIDRGKIIKKLLNKGFIYDDIKKIIE